MENNIEITDHGSYLHCDNPQCGYDMNFEGKIREELIGTPCPKCGENMLTKEDYEAGKDLRELLPEFVNLTNTLSQEQIDYYYQKAIEEFPELKELSSEDLVKCSIHIHNNKLNINIENNE